jgi:hypothetical protein
MSAKTEAKEKSGGSGILLLLLAIGGLWLWKKNKDTKAAGATDDTIPDYSGGGGGGGYDGAYADDVVVVDVGNGATGNGGGSSGSGSSSGSVTPIKQAMTARTLDPEWQYQKSRINMAVIPDYQKRQIEKGAVTKNTLKSIADYQQVKAGTLSAFDYANDPNMPEEMRAGIEYSSTAYQGSATTVRNRALSYYAGQTGTHRGSMTAAERTAWDSANEQAALTAYAAAAGSGLQADRARELAGTTLTGKISIEQAGTMKTTQPVTPKKAIADDPNRLVRQTWSRTPSKGTDGIALGASKSAEAARIAAGKAARTSTTSKGSAQPGKGSTSSGKTAAKTVSKAAATKGIAGAVKAAASLSKK